MWYTTIKRYYDVAHHSYNDESLKNFVKAGMITEAQYAEITDVEYLA